MYCKYTYILMILNFNFTKNVYVVLERVWSVKTFIRFLLLVVLCVEMSAHCLSQC